MGLCNTLVIGPFGAGGFSTGSLFLVVSCVLALQYPVIFLPTLSPPHLFTCKLAFLWLLLLIQADMCYIAHGYFTVV